MAFNPSGVGDLATQVGGVGLDGPVEGATGTIFFRYVGISSPALPDMVGVLTHNEEPDNIWKWDNSVQKGLIISLSVYMWHCRLTPMHGGLMIT